MSCCTLGALLGCFQQANLICGSVSAAVSACHAAQRFPPLRWWLRLVAGTRSSGGDPAVRSCCPSRCEAAFGRAASPQTRALRASSAPFWAKTHFTCLGGPPSHEHVTTVCTTPLTSV